MPKYFLILFCLFLSSCGFHTRESLALSAPLQNLYLQTADPYGQLTRDLHLSLKMSNVHLAKTPEEATTILDILSEDTSDQLLNINGTQATRQYNLILTVTYRITDKHGNILVSTQTARETRPLTINATQMLSGSNQAMSLYEQMRQAIANDIMNRLASREISTLLIKKPDHP